MIFSKLQFSPEILIFSTLLPATAVAYDDSPKSEEIKAAQSELRRLSLDELLDTEITSVSKKNQKLSDSAAAISVITQEDIKRSAATTLPDVLRLATGLQVTQTNGHTWSISARGFNDVYAAKLLVLIDGRSIYMPDFSGVMWDMQDMILEDIERIEVIRGSGGTIWGANAVNGVINIITKHGKDTVGGLISAGAGIVNKAFGSIRYGVALNDHSYLRVYAKGLQQDAFQDSQVIQEKLWVNQPPKIGTTNDAWWSQHAGLRIDSDTSGSTHWMLQTETNHLEKSNYGFYSRSPDTQIAHGAHVLGSLKQSLSEDSDFAVQAYYDYVQRDFNILNVRNDTLDVDMHQRWRFSPQHEFTWGGGYRIITADSKNNTNYQYLPGFIHRNILNLFIQDEITLSPTLKLTLGNKLERNDATGWENQPNIRAIWKVTPEHSVWSAISRSVRTPSRVEQDIALTYSMGSQAQLGNGLVLPILSAVSGTKDIRSEKQRSYELGWRFQPNKKLSLDTAVFLNKYDDLISIAYGTPYLNPTLPALISPIAFKNMGKASTSGIELNADWHVTPQWQLHAGYTYLHNVASLFNNSTAPAITTLFMMGLNAHHQLSLRSHWNFAQNWQWDIDAHWLSRIDRAPNEGAPQASSINAYVTLDSRLAWQMNKSIELSLVGKNLFSPQHLELMALRGSDLLNTEVPRSAYLQLRWAFN